MPSALLRKLPVSRGLKIRLQLNQADELDPATRKHPNGLDSNPHKFTALTVVSQPSLCHVDRELTAWSQVHTSDGFYLPFTVSWKQSKIHFSPQDSWHTCAPASSTGKKTRCFLVSLPPNSCASLLLPHTGGQASTVSSWTWSPSWDLRSICSIAEVHSRNAMIILISLERLHAFPCLRSSSLGTCFERNHCVLKTRLRHEIWAFSCPGHNKMQEIESKCAPKNYILLLHASLSSPHKYKPWKVKDFKLIIQHETVFRSMVHNTATLQICPNKHKIRLSWLGEYIF